MLEEYENVSLEYMLTFDHHRAIIGQNSSTHSCVIMPFCYEIFHTGMGITSILSVFS